jgi:signal recognition particle subunit SEC65
MEREKITRAAIEMIRELGLKRAVRKDEFFHPRVMLDFPSGGRLEVEQTPELMQEIEEVESRMRQLYTIVVRADEVTEITDGEAESVDR